MGTSYSPNNVQIAFRAASISPNAVMFDKNISSAAYADITIILDSDGYTLAALKPGSDTLTAGRDYTVSNAYTLKKEYLAMLNPGAQTITFEMSGGAVVNTDASYTFTFTGGRDLVANFEPLSVPELTLSGIPKDGLSTPSIDGGDWDWDGDYFSATFNSLAAFTAKKAGTSIITCTAGGQSASAAITIKKAADLPQTGDDGNMILWIALGLSSILAGAGLLVWKKARDMGYIR